MIIFLFDYLILKEDEGPSIGSYAGTKRGKKVDYTASMNFVSAGIAGKEKVKSKKKQTINIKYTK